MNSHGDESLRNCFVVPSKSRGERRAAIHDSMWFTPSGRFPLRSRYPCSLIVIFMKKAYFFSEISFESASGKLCGCPGRGRITLISLTELNRLRSLMDCWMPSGSVPSRYKVFQ